MRTHRSFLRPALAFLAMLAVSSTAQAIVTVQAYWTLGEAGTIGTNNRPLDSSGNARNFVSDQAGAGVTVSGAVDPRAAAIGSTNSYLFPTGGARGFFNAGFDAPENNVGIEAFARVVDVAGLSGDRNIFSTGGGNGLKVQIVNGAWASSYDNVAFVGGTSPAVLNEWVHLALVRDNGIGMFFVNGLQVGATSLAVPGNATVPHLGVNSGGAAGFFGNIDQVRVFTFAPGQFSTRDLLIGVPEPSSLLLLGASLAGLMTRRRKA